MKKIIIYTLVTLIVIFGGLAAYLYFSNDYTLNNPDTDTNTVDPVPSPGTSTDSGDYNTQSSGDFTLKYRYEGNSQWTYVITGFLPTPCYLTDVSAIVRESFPEQVSIKLKVSQPQTFQACVEVIKEYTYEGVFSASEGASVEFLVVK
ncbi:hypothetical protein HYV12_03275 [Candidatus Dojkabacteria bacterium]|nr:hypothetical protein [Candidatus Dojkabacteria bacterium]